MKLKCIPFGEVCGRNFHVAHAVNWRQEARPLRSVAQAQTPCEISSESVANSQECGGESWKTGRFL